MKVWNIFMGESMPYSNKTTKHQLKSSREEAIIRNVKRSCQLDKYGSASPKPYLS